MNIDWNFIRNLEGYSIIGYIPKGSARSGVTICCGFDIGQLSPGGLRLLDIDQSLKDKLQKYTGITGNNARALLANNPLTISPGEADQIQHRVELEFENGLQEKYEDFNSWTSQQQTVVASVSYQYGIDLDKVCPKMYTCIVHKMWNQAVAELKDFGDAYTTRRLKEAAYLEGSN